MPIKPLVGTVTLMRTSQGILATGKLRTKLRVELQALSGTLRRRRGNSTWKRSSIRRSLIADAPVDRVPREEEDEALMIDAHHILDLSEVIRQGLWLATPMDLLCRPDCAGLCPNCGGNRNLGECQCDQEAIDPRWAALQELLSKEPES